MKIVMLIGDGMGDDPLQQLGGKTPLQFANIPHIRQAAAMGTVRLMTTVPAGLPPGSDVANLSIMGFDPRHYYTGRAPIEAAGAGLQLAPDDVAFRCNLITVKDDAIHDHSAGHITTEEARLIIDDLNQTVGGSTIRFELGTSYRHLLIWKNGPADAMTTPPHDVLGQAAQDHLPKGPGADEILKLMDISKKLLRQHPVNTRRQQQGLSLASQIWLWGQGRQTVLPAYPKTFGLQGGVISAVNLVRGIGRLAGLEAPEVPGATGYLDTNYKGKVEAALKILQNKDFALIHVEAPDECSHQGNLLKKISAIEAFDQQVVAPVWLGLQKMQVPYRMIIATDHRTPVTQRNHTSGPVPVLAMDGPVKMALAEKPYDESVNNGESQGMVFEWLSTLLLSGKPAEAS